METVIETDRLGKSYRRTRALADCDLSLPAGSLVALVGPNGAGKTTLMSILAGLITQTSGTARVMGAAAGSRQARGRVALVTQGTPVYRSLRVREHLHLAGNLNQRWDQDRARARLDRLGIPLQRRARKLSGGQRAQLALTLALARRPDLLLLDEPLAQLDPLARRDVLTEMAQLASGTGICVLFSSHVLTELDRVADHLIVLTGGKVQVAGRVDQLVAEMEPVPGGAAPTMEHIALRYLDGAEGR